VLHPLCERANPMLHSALEPPRSSISFCGKGPFARVVSTLLWSHELCESILFYQPTVLRPSNPSPCARLLYEQIRVLTRTNPLKGAEPGASKASLVPSL